MDGQGNKIPIRHLIPDQTDQSKVEQGGVRSFTFNYTNEFQKSDLEIFKQGTVKNKRGDLGVEANLQNAVYELYADHEITGSDNKSVVYKAGTLVTQMVTDADGYAKVTDLYRDITVYMRSMLRWDISYLVMIYQSRSIKIHPSI